MVCSSGLLAALLVLGGGADPAPPSSRALTLVAAVAAARDNHPDLRQASAAYEAGAARADQRRSGLLPQVAGSASYERSTSNFASRPGSVPSSLGVGAASSFATSDYFNVGASVDQLVFDFWQTPNQWRAASLSAEALAETRRATLVRVLANVRNAYFGARAAKALLGVARETLANQERHLGQIQGFVEVGTRPDIDLAQARTDLANARVQLILGSNGYATAKAQLRTAMGTPMAGDFEVADETMPVVPGEDLPLEQLVDEAVVGKPELMSLLRQQEALERTASAAGVGWLPRISVGTAVSDAGPQLNRLVWNWNGGVTMSWPLFAGGLALAQSHEAGANVAAMAAQRDSLGQQVRLQVEQTQLAVGATRAALGAADEAVVNARERLRLAEGRYETGVGSVIELGDAQLALTSALGQRVQAEYQLATARASLLQALGRE